MAFRAKLRHRWRSWLAIAILISVVGGFVLAAAAAGRRTEAAFPQFVAAHGFDTEVYATHPVPEVAKLPGVVSATVLVSPATGQPTCACTHPINPTDFGVILPPPSRQIALQARLRPLARSVSAQSGAGIVHLSDRTTGCTWGA